MKSVIVVAGGSPDLWPKITKRLIEENDWIGVDRGSLYLIEHGITPSLAIGDFDSLTKEELELVRKNAKEIIYAHPEKDYTDTELGMIEAIKRYPEGTITLLGATGGRLDHLLSNIWLPLHPEMKSSVSRIHLQDNQNKVSYYEPGEYRIVKQKEMTYLAFICLTQVKALSLLDTKYRLDKKDVTCPKSYGSNEFLTNEAHFSFEEGLVAVIQSRD